MKASYLIILLSLFIFSCNKNQESKSLKKTKKELKFEYDSILAQKIGADDYGMKKYVMAFLKSGPNRSQDSTTRAQLQRAHLDNIKKLAENGKLVLAGPFFGNDSIRGIYIFDVSSIEEAKQLTNTDPAIKAGTLVMELKEWYGSAALVLLNNEHKKITKKQI